MTTPTFPYRRDIRPQDIEGLGGHTDREFEKIEQAFALYEQRIADLEARVTALEP